MAQSFRTRHAEKIFLNVYDLSTANDYMLWDLGFGLHHTGIQVHGDEWTFSSGGVFYHRPRGAPNVKFRTQILLGTCHYSSSKVKAVVDTLRAEFVGEAYNVVGRNCNHFSDALSRSLLNKSIPGYINRLANIGKCISCLLPKSLVGSSPVTDESGISMSTLKAGKVGVGIRLGEGNESATLASDVRDLREKRLAYLDR